MFKKVDVDDTDLVTVLKKGYQTIVPTNAAFNKAFNITQEDLVGIPMSAFFSSDRFQGNSEDILTANNRQFFTHDYK